MKFVWCAALSVSISLTGSPAAVAPSAEATAPADAVAKGVEQLGEESFKVREGATRQLWEMGSEAVPRLREAMRGTNPEIAKRAAYILRKIELGLTPETPEAVLSLIERYTHANREEKLKIVFELQKLGAWRQILKLYSLESDGEVKARIRPKVEEVAISAARESIVGGKTEEALGFLQMAPPDADGLMALAEFHRTHGTLKAELAKASTKGAEQAFWRLALLRASGDVKGARAAAVDAHEPRIAAVMDMLDGDPLPWLRGAPSGDGAPGLHDIYLQLAEKHWNGETLQAKDFEPLQPFMRASNDDQSNRWMACGIYFLMGELAPGEAGFTKISPVATFRYFDLLERVPEALKVIGLDPQKPDYAAWIEKHAKAVIDHPDESDEEQVLLAALASFMERRGLRAELKTFDPFLAKLAAEDTEVFMGMLTSLFGSAEAGSGAVSLAKRAASAYAGDDDAKWGEVLNGVFGDNHQSNKWWSWMGVLDPAANRQARFDGLMALMRLGIDPGHLRKHWLKLAWDSIDAMPKGEAQERLAMMRDLALQSNDLTSGLKAWDQLLEEIGNDDDNEMTDRSGSYLLYLSAAGRWEDAATLWMKLIAKTPARPEFHAYAAACFRRAGKDDDAQREDELAEKLALADPITCIRIGQAYSYGGDFQRAGQWWERVIIQCSPENPVWVKALAIHGLERTQVGDWKRAASVNEVLACNGYENGGESPSLKIRLRVSADFTRALSRLKTDRENSINLLARCHGLLAADGSLADYFFPALRKAGLMEQHDAWFERSWQILQPVIKAYPAGDNTRNTAAWMAARAGRRLDEAEDQVDKALESSPEQAAYLDTKAEIAFARKDRKRALELSMQSLISDPLDESLRHQLERYRSSPFPIP